MWLLVGGDSEIGAATHRHLRARGFPVAATTRRADRVSAERPFLDLAAPLDAFEPPKGTRRACVFAAVARLAACNADPSGSALINVTQTLALAERLIARGIAVLFLSTNQVFDGNTPHMPADAPVSPISEYGRQKARMETGLRQHMDRHARLAVLRLAKVVSPDMPLIRGWIGRLRAGEPIRAFHDMSIAPVPTDMVAEVIVALLQEEARGVFQLAGPRDVPYAEVGRFLADRLSADPALVTAASAREAGLPEEATPRHTTLDSSRLRERYGFTAPDVWNVVDSVIDATWEPKLREVVGNRLAGA